MRLIMFPGLGADERLFAYQTKEIPQIEVPAWIPPIDGESLAEYGRRILPTINLKSDDFIGGMSFGGQLALEIARQAKCEGVLLVAANRRASEISPTFRLQTSLLNTLPEELVRSILKNMAIPRIEKEEKLSAQPVQWLREMSDSMDFTFFKWSAQAAASWDYNYDPSDFTGPIFQVRGENDNIIAISNPSEVDTIPAAGHLINYTHPEELNRWILEKTGIVPPASEPLINSG